MTAHEREADSAAASGGPRAYSLAEIRLQREIDTARGFLREIEMAAKEGRPADLGDTGLLLYTAKVIRELVWQQNIDTIRTATPEQDKAAQGEMARAFEALVPR